MFIESHRFSSELWLVFRWTQRQTDRSIFKKAVTETSTYILVHTDRERTDVQTDRGRTYIQTENGRTYWQTENGRTFRQTENRRTDVLTDRCTDRQKTDGRTDRQRTDGRTDRQRTDGRTDIQRTDGRTDRQRTAGRTDIQIEKIACNYQGDKRYKVHRGISLIYSLLLSIHIYQLYVEVPNSGPFITWSGIVKLSTGCKPLIIKSISHYVFYNRCYVNKNKTKTTGRRYNCFWCSIAYYVFCFSDHLLIITYHLCCWYSCYCLNLRHVCS